MNLSSLKHEKISDSHSFNPLVSLAGRRSQIRSYNKVLGNADMCADKIHTVVGVFFLPGLLLSSLLLLFRQ